MSCTRQQLNERVTIQAGTAASMNNLVSYNPGFLGIPAQQRGRFIRWFVS